MSHFVTLVFHKENGRDVESLLAPYDENITYAPYVCLTKQQAIEKVRDEIDEYKNTVYADYLNDKEAYKSKHPNAQHINYLENEFPKKLNWTDEQCYEQEAGWYDEDMITPNGDLLSTYNPNSKWDWWTEGGRWSNYLKTKSGEGTDEDYASEIEWKDAPFAYITPDGVWHEKGRMLYWGITADEKEKDVWEKEFHDFIHSADDNLLVTVIDCHI